METLRSESMRTSDQHLSKDNSSYLLTCLQSILPVQKYNIEVIETLNKPFDLFLVSKKPTSDEHLPLFRLLARRTQSEKLILSLMSYHGKTVDETVIDNFGQNSTSIEALKDYLIKFEECLTVCQGLPESATGMTILKASTRFLKDSKDLNNGLVQYSNLGHLSYCRIVCH